MHTMNLDKLKLTLISEHGSRQKKKPRLTDLNKKTNAVRRWD